MATTAAWSYTATGVSKAQAIVLFMEFWTSKGFNEHSASYNRLALRRNGYGTFTSWLDSNFAMEINLANAPMELTVLVQVRPNHTKYDMTFTLGSGISEEVPGGLMSTTKHEVNEFVSFINDWTAQARRELP